MDCVPKQLPQAVRNLPFSFFLRPPVLLFYTSFILNDCRSLHRLQQVSRSTRIENPAQNNLLTFPRERLPRPPQRPSPRPPLFHPRPTAQGDLSLLSFFPHSPAGVEDPSSPRPRFRFRTAGPGAQPNPTAHSCPFRPVQHDRPPQTRPRPTAGGRPSYVHLAPIAHPPPKRANQPGWRHPIEKP